MFGRNLAEYGYPKAGGKHLPVDAWVEPDNRLIGARVIDGVASIEIAGIVIDPGLASSRTVVP